MVGPYPGSNMTKNGVVRANTYIGKRAVNKGCVSSDLMQMELALKMED